MAKGDLCGAKRSTDGEPCKNPAGAGTPHVGWGRCKWHFGSTPSMIQSAAKQEMIWMAEQHMLAAGQPIEVEPAEVLMQEVHRSAGVVGFLEYKLMQMDPDVDLVDLTAYGSVPRAFIQVYREERAHLAKVAKLALDAGVAERQVRIAENQGRLLAQVIQAVLKDLSLDEDQAALAPGIVRKHLMSVAVAESA